MAENNAEQVECRDELLTNILSRVPTRDVLKMSAVGKRWHTLIWNRGFVHTHFRNCHKESIIFLTHTVELPTPQQYQFHCYNYQAGNLSIVPFSLEGLDTSFRNGTFDIVAASNGLICFHEDLYADNPTDVPVLWVYNPVIKLTLPLEIDLEDLHFAEICYTQNTLKFVMAGMSFFDQHPYTLVFDSQLNSWYSGQPLPLLPVTDIGQYYPLIGTEVFFNGVIYFIVRVRSGYAQALEGFEEGLYEDGDDLLHVIIGYDVNQDQWDFSLFVPAPVGYIYGLTEWVGNLLVCASMSYGWYNNDGHFVFWILDTKHKLWIRERELNLSHELQTSWDASARGDVVWFECDPNTVIVYHMKSRHWSRHRLDNAVRTQPRNIPFATFEPTLLSF